MEKNWLQLIAIALNARKSERSRQSYDEKKGCVHRIPAERASIHTIPQDQRNAVLQVVCWYQALHWSIHTIHTVYHGTAKNHIYF